jgi:SAM-dependent methyltransferase
LTAEPEVSYAETVDSKDCFINLHTILPSSSGGARIQYGDPPDGVVRPSPCQRYGGLGLACEQPAHGEFMNHTIKRVANRLLKPFNLTVLRRTALDTLVAQLDEERAELQALRSEKSAGGPINIPMHLHGVGGGDPVQLGMHFMRLFRRLGCLKSTDRVLDLGCGVGRMAVPLLFFLDEHGSYAGLDINRPAIEWCQEHITSLNRKFCFQVADIRNQQYNPNGKIVAEEYTLPYEDESFDFVFLTSVFTHMLPKSVERYLGEIRRVLKPGKNCFITFFIINEESASLVESGAATLNFRHDFGLYRTVEPDRHEAAIGYKEDFLRAIYKKYSLAIREPIDYGSWCGRPPKASHQDIIVASRV